MDAFGSAPMGYGGLGWPRLDSRNLVVKVKYGDTLKRFNACVNGSHFDHDLPALRLKIASAFKFSPDAEFILTYTDEDGDVVMLDDDNDLRDAAVNQNLNPLRINVQLKSSNVGAARTKQQATNSKSPRSISLEDQLAQVKSAIDEALMFVPEQVPAVLAKLSHDLRSRAALTAPALSELLDRFAKLIARSSNIHPSWGSADSSQKLRNLEIKLESTLVTGSASEPSDGQNSGISEAGLRGVLSQDPTAKIEQAPSCPSLKDSLVFTSSGGSKSDFKRSLDSAIKGRSDACSKGKSVMSSEPPASTHGAPTQQSAVPFTSCGSIGMGNGDMRSLFPPPPVVYPPTPILYPTLTPFNPISGANGKTTGDLHSMFPPPVYSPIKLNTPSSAGTFSPNLYSTGRSSHRDRTASLFSSYVTNREGSNSFGSSYSGLGTNYGGRGIPQRAQHRWIQCDGCGVTPIVGPRYKSNVKVDYDLCGACFSHMGNEVEYTRLDSPASRSNIKFLGKIPAVKTDSRFNKEIPALKTDSRFIKDVTVPDGTLMAPSTPFTKIWRMRNNGSTFWPYGTHLLWVGGDRLTCLSSVRLAISTDGGLNPCEQTDVAVDFLAPAKSGRYISYWRLALPSGLTFGQQIWVHIEVEQPIQTSGNKQTASTILSQLPEANSTRPFTFNMNNAPVEVLSGWPRSTWPNRLASETMEPKESEPVPGDMPFAPAAVEPVQIPVTNVTASPAEAAAVPAPEAVLPPNPVQAPAPAPAPVSAPAPAPSAAPVCAPVVAVAPPPVLAAPLPEEAVDHLLEEKMMSELEVLGFMKADLNKQMLRQNNYDLEQSVVDLCGFNEWDPLEGFSELGSDDAEMSEEVVDNSDDEGFVVADLMSKAKKNQ
ncbi:unnamed protein product [Urochloa decumbens]|uniref:Uncharacterized protein n=1 Tax=Urochloa decumbens TaxID=240449 RepID=A0ABC9F279_9POAL